MMTRREKFEQGLLIAPDSLGICMRVTFKWVALKVAKGEFKYEKINVTKTEKKMAAYGDPFIQKLCDKNFSALDSTQSQAYIDEDVKSIKSYAGLWGQRIVDKNKKEFKGITAKDGLAVTSLRDYVNSTQIDWSKFHAIYSFYMRLGASELEKVLGPTGKVLSTGVRAKVEDTTRTIMAGHVVGISGSDNTFFDANTGMYDFDNSDPKKIVDDIELHVTNTYHPEQSYKRGLVVIGM